MIIFVGDKPSPRMKPGAKPFEGAACEQRLCDWILHLLLDLENRTYDVINSDNSFRMRQLEYEVCQGKHKVVALGNNASKALKGIPHFKLPHPSGRNRQINDKDFIAKKLNECKLWLRS